MRAVCLILAATVLSAGPLHAQKKKVNKVGLALAKKTTVEFVDTPLVDVVKYISDLHKIDIELAKKELTEEGISTDEPITLSLKDKTLQSTLNIMLEPLGVTYLSSSDKLQITSITASEEKLETRTYPIGRLPQAAMSEVISSMTDAYWLDIEGTGGSIQGGGNGFLRISQTQHAHASIENLLLQITRIIDARRAPKPTAVEKSEDALRKQLSR